MATRLNVGMRAFLPARYNSDIPVTWLYNCLNVKEAASDVRLALRLGVRLVRFLHLNGGNQGRCRGERAGRNVPHWNCRTVAQLDELILVLHVSQVTSMVSLARGAGGLWAMTP